MPPVSVTRNWSVVLPTRLVREQVAVADISPVLVNRSIYITPPTVSLQGHYRVPVAAASIRAVPVHLALVPEVLAAKNIIRRPVLRFVKKQNQITVITGQLFQRRMVVRNIGLTAHQNAKRLIMIIAGIVLR